MDKLNSEQIRIRVLNKGNIGRQGIKSAKPLSSTDKDYYGGTIDAISKERWNMLNTKQYDELYATIEDVAREELGIDFNDTSMIEWLDDAKASEKLEIELLDETTGRLLIDAGLPATEWRKVDLLRRCCNELSKTYEDG